MTEAELQTLLNEKFGEIYQQMMAGDPETGRTIMAQLVQQIHAAYTGSK